VDAGHERPDDADVGGAELAAPDVDERPARQQQVEGLEALRGGDGTSADVGIDGVDGHGLLLIRRER
jgi:hypothetical protein